MVLSLTVWNRAPTWVLKGLTPYEAWHGHKPDVSHLREFGCNVWILNELKNWSKLHPRSHKMIFVGFDDGAKCIHYYDKATQVRHVKRSWNFKFNKNEEPWELETTQIPGLQAEGEKLDGPPSQTTPSRARNLSIKFMTQNHRIYGCPPRKESPISHQQTINHSIGTSWYHTIYRIFMH